MNEETANLIYGVVWMICCTYLLGLFVMGLFGKYKQHRERANKQYRIMLKQEDGDPLEIDVNFDKDRSTST